MRNINFSSISSDNIVRNPTPIRPFQKQDQYSVSHSNKNSNIQDYRFLTKPILRLDEKEHTLNQNQIRHSFLSRCPTKNQGPQINNTNIYSPSNFNYSRNDPIVEKSSIGTIKTPYSQVSTVESSIKNEKYVSNSIYKLPLLPPNKFSISESMKITNSKLKERISHLELNQPNSNIQNDTQLYKKRSLQHVYMHKSDEEEEFYDAISDDEGTGEYYSSNQNKKSNVLPPLKKTYNQTPHSQSEISVIGNKTITRSTNKYGLPISMIDEDFNLEENLVSGSTNNKFQESNLSSTKNTIQYSHPYNFPKSTLLPSSIETKSNSISSSVQRIRTPLRYRSNLFGAISNKSNSSCRILSAAEMRKVFCKSKKPIGSLKDFIHKVEVRNENSGDNGNSDDTKIFDKKTETENTNIIVNENKDNLATKHIEVDARNATISATGVLTKNTEKDVTLNVIDSSSKNVQGLNTNNELPKSLFPTSLSQDSPIKDSICSEILDSKSRLNEEDNATESKEQNERKEDIEKLKNKVDDNSKLDNEKKDAVPWWLANIDKPNLVEIDNDNVFLSDEENETSSEKKASSPKNLFSLTSNSDNNKPIESIFSLNSEGPKDEKSTSISLFGDSFSQINKVVGKESPETLFKLSENNSSFSNSLTSSNLFSSNTNNEKNMVSLFGVSPNLNNQPFTQAEISNTESQNKETNSKSTESPSVNLSLFNQQKLNENEQKSSINDNKSAGVFNLEKSGSLFESSIQTTNEFSDSKEPNSNVKFGAPSIQNSTQVIFESEQNLKNSTLNNSINSNMNPNSLFSNTETAENKIVREIKFGNELSNTSNPNNSSISEIGSINSSMGLTTSSLFDNKLPNVQESSNSLISNSIPSTLTDSISNKSSKEQSNQLFGTFSNGKVTLPDFNISKGATESSSIFEVKNISNISSGNSSSNVNLEANANISNNSLAISSNPTSNIQQNTSIFGTNNSPFIFGSNSNNRPINQNFLQNTNQLQGQTSNSSLFNGTSNTLFGSSKPETNLFGSMTNNSVSPFENRTNTSTQANVSNIFGSNPSNILGSSALIGNNTNPFVCYTSNSGGTSHRRRIARAKRSH